MTNAKLTPGQVAVLRSARALDEDTARSVRATIFSQAKLAFGIPENEKVKVEIDDLGNPYFAELTRKKTGMAYPVYLVDGKWTCNTPPLPRAPQEARWFTVSQAALDNVVEDILGDHDFLDGSSTLSGERSEFDVGLRTLALDEDGDLYVKVARDSFAEVAEGRY